MPSLHVIIEIPHIIFSSTVFFWQYVAVLNIFHISQTVFRLNGVWDWPWPPFSFLSFTVVGYFIHYRAQVSLLCFASRLLCLTFCFHIKHDLFIIWLTWVIIFQRNKLTAPFSMAFPSKHENVGFLVSVGRFIVETGLKEKRNATSLQQHAVCWNCPSPCFAHKPSHLTRLCACVYARNALCVSCTCRLTHICLLMKEAFSS